jgi:hypothetical protein
VRKHEDLSGSQLGLDGGGHVLLGQGLAGDSSGCVWEVCLGHYWVSNQLGIGGDNLSVGAVVRVSLCKPIISVVLPHSMPIHRKLTLLHLPTQRGIQLATLHALVLTLKLH